ncbi:hypothetical protein RFI_26202 [Reticulomyxa filosa]|uniref:Sec7/BIG1-like C-terminal domain-containing protein n=1 Tax=Reticulomyxa filosa TaxID=46433 RepID=X6MCJ5_RETFI|nr:hypothetical protein RFI_26202 [Reticulomyxa filosa]|eukprot:ETO11172.1 hypothetical protein RFI_26202 [Reticulomyxa filosa]
MNIALAQTVVHQLMVECLFQVEFILACQQNTLSSHLFVVLLHSMKVTIQQMDIVITCFEESHKFARQFNLTTDLRNHLWSLGFMEHQKSPPDLYYQESRSASVLLETMLTLCTHYVPTSFAIRSDDELKNQIFDRHRSTHLWDRFFEFTNQLLTDYFHDSNEYYLNKNKSEAATGTSNANAEAHEENESISIRWKTGVILTLLDSLLSDKCVKDNTQRIQILEKLYDNVVKCVEVENKEIRKRIVILFSQHIKPFVFQGELPNF